MAGQILVVLKRHDRIGEVLPYIEKIAQPGRRVVFLIPYPVERWLWFRDHWVATESREEAVLAGRKIMAQYSWEMQRGLAEQKLSIACEALHNKGMQVCVDICTRSIRRAIKDYMADRETDLVLLPARDGHPLIGLLYRTLSLFGAVKRTGCAPVLLLHPGE